MKKVFILILVIFISSISFASSEGERKGQLLTIIDEELREVIRLNKQTNGRNPELVLQLAELELEKARILKEVETDKYLAIDPSQRSKINQKSFFKQSTAYFNEAKKQCIFLLRKFPHYNGKADAYYIIAYHARDVEKDIKKATKYFSYARKYSKNGSVVYSKSTMALAEMYYNQRQYQKAIPLYVSSLRGKKNRWWTKDAHSLAWSYFRVGKKDTAIKVMENVLALSKRDQFIDMSANAERDLAYFYSATGKTDDAVKLAGKVGGNSVDYLIKVALHSKNQGHHGNAADILEKAMASGASREQQAQIHAALLDIYDRLGNYDKQLIHLNKLDALRTSGKIDEQYVENIKYFAQKSAATLQKAVIGKAYRHNNSIRLKKAELAVGFLNTLQSVKPESAARVELLIGETYYAVSMFNEAIPHYDKALLLSQQRNDKKVEKEALTGLSTSLEQKSVKKELKDQYLIKTYIAFLKKNPRGKEAYTVYQRLFNLYFEAKDMKGAESSLMAFKNNFSKSIGVQEAMLGKIIDFYKGQKDIDAMKGWLDRINKNEFIVNNKFKQSLSTIITTMRFENVETANSRGDKVAALKGYITLYSDPSSSEYEKKNAAYNIAILFHMLGNADMTYKFTKRALDHMTGDDVKKFESTFITLATFFFNRRMFDKAIDINESVYIKTCNTATTNKEVFYKNVYVMKIAEHKASELPSFIEGGFACKIPVNVINKARIEVANEFAEQKSWGELNAMLAKLDKEHKLWPELIPMRYALYKAYEEAGRYKLAISEKNIILKYYNYGERNNMTISLESRDIVANFKLKDLYQESQRLSAIKLQFPEKIYNSTLQKKFKVLDQVTSKALEMLKVRSGRGIVRAYKYLVETYDDMANEIKQFTPPGKSAEYLAGFKKAMAQLALPLEQQSRKFRSDALRQISVSNILSKDNLYFTAKEGLPVNVEYQYHISGVIMDRGGKK